MGNFESYLAFSKHTKWLLTAAIAVVPLKTIEKWCNNTPNCTWPLSGIIS